MTKPSQKNTSTKKLTRTAKTSFQNEFTLERQPYFKNFYVSLAQCELSQSLYVNLIAYILCSD
jgi:hypothetical protein